MRRPSFPILVFLLLAGGAVAGCLAPQDAATAAGVDPAPAAPAGATTAVVHRAPPPGVVDPADLTPPANATPLPLPDPGLPVAVGALRLSPLSSFEPTLGVGSDGSIYLSTFANPSPKRTLLQKSSDQGLTWTDVTPGVGPVSLPPQSNDPYVYVDPDTDRIFLSDLQALVCSTLSFSDDGGASWTTNPVGCGHPFGVHDHQTVFTANPRTLPTSGYDKVVYYCINRVADSACATSLNGGLGFGPLVPVFTQANSPPACGGLHAHGAAAPDGTVFIPKGHCGVPMVAISQDDGLTWEIVTISETVASPGHEVAFAVDEAGHAYAFWIGPENLPYLAISEDGGWTWREPIMVAPPGVGTTAFPTVAAGADGRVVVAYYGTARAVKYGDMKEADTWNAYLTILTDALAEEPVLQTVTVNDPADPVARGVCGGTRCNGVGDFIDVVIDGEGRPWAALVKVCNDACATPAGKENSGSFGFVGTLAAGPRLRGALEALPALVETTEAADA